MKGLSGLQRKMAEIYNKHGTFLEEQSRALGIPVEAAAAVLYVESGGRGFSSTGKMIIRFENHIFYKYWGKDHPEEFWKHFTFDKGKSWTGHKFRIDESSPWQSFHGSQSREWQAFELARGMAESEAIMSISMGAPQIMGFNYKAIGYSSLQEMFESFSKGIGPQLQGLFDFIKRSGPSVKALKAHDWVKFATYYTGPGQAEAHASRLEAPAKAYQSVLELAKKSAKQ